MFSHIAGTMCGLATIRSAEAEEMVKKHFDSLQDVHTSTQQLAIFLEKTFGFYLECLWNIVVAVVTLKFMVFRQGKNKSICSKSQVNCTFTILWHCSKSLPENTRGGDIGLVITQSSIIAGVFQFTITKTTETIAGMVSVERILQYSDIEKEEAFEVSNRQKLMKRWPHSGKISFSNVYLTYAPGEAPVLKNLNLCIKAGERVLFACFLVRSEAWSRNHFQIGIVGRTGAGKSSLISCLFRLAPIEGSIAIDDIDTAIVDFKTLRSRISIIPQEPVLFSDSIRYNLDPFGIATDETLWKVLENVSRNDLHGWKYIWYKFHFVRLN